MTSRPARWIFPVGALLLLGYATLFPLLTVDTLGRVMKGAAHYETRNVLVLLFLELTRLFASSVAILIALVLIARGWQRSDARALAIFLLFAVIAYEKVFGSNSYPGPFQEHIARALMAAGLAPAALAWLFGPLDWALWPAMAAALRFSVVMPHELRPEALDASGRADRRGLMRSTGVAGADIGAFFRSVSKALLRAGGFRPQVLGAAALAMIVAHTLLHGVVARLILYALAGLAVCIAVTNMRAAYQVAEGADRARATWIIEGFFIALFMFLVSAVVLLVVPTPNGARLAFIFVMLIPVAVSVCLALSVLDHGELDSRNAVDHTARAAIIALAVIVTFGVLYAVLGFVGDRFGMSRALPALAALAGAAAAFRPVRKAADRLRLRVLERSGAA